MSADGDFDRATIDLTRHLLAVGDRRRARAVLQTMQRYESLRPIADICLAVCATTEPMPDTAWRLFSRNDLALITRHLAGEYFRFAFWWRPDEAGEALRRVLRGELPIEADAGGWYEIALDAFAAGCEDGAAGALDRAETLLRDDEETPESHSVRRQVTWLRSWIGRAAAAEQTTALATGEVPFALITYSHPSQPAVSADITDRLQTAIALGHVLRHEGVQLAGDPGLLGAIDEMRGLLRSDNRIPHSGEHSVRLYTMDRDASRYSAMPGGTWALVSEWFVRPLAGRHFDIPLNPRVRPIFAGFHITVAALNAPGVIDYLRRYAPIGCLDWDTVFLLHAAGIPAFFTGGLTATSDVLLSASQGSGGPSVYVDVEADGPGEVTTHLSRQVTQRGLAGGLVDATRLLRRYRDSGARVVTRDLRAYLAVRGVGTATELRLSDNGPARFSDHLSLSDKQFTAVQESLSDKLAAVLGAIVEGRPEDEVYATWRTVCAPDVALAEKRLGDVGPAPKLTFDLGEVCSTILAQSVVVERTDTSPQGPEINVEFSLDGNYKHQLDIALDSVVAHTSRPVRAFVLCREHSQDDFDRMATLFPSVSFVWLPTDNVNYGRISDMNKWVTPATMDRTILPELLPDVDRILHFDLDALCLSDIAELYDVEMDGAPIASTPEPQPKFVSGFETYRWSANRLRREGSPERARELTLRTHAKDHFDFDVFNAGIMVMDLAKMRADDFCGSYLPYVQHYGLNGQIVLNAYTGNAVKYVDPRWNQLVRIEMLDEPKIAHWAGPMKPWKKTLYVAGRELWDEGERRFAQRVEKTR